MCTGTNPAPTKKTRTVLAGSDASVSLSVCDKQGQEIKELKAKCRALRAERGELRKQLEACGQQARLAESVCADRLEALARENNELLVELDSCLGELDLRALECVDLREQLETAQSELESLRNAGSGACSWQEDCAACLEDQGCSGDCPAYDLCSKRILIVGGIERMESRYRRLIEKEGGVLDYHDGNMQGGVKKLERCLQKADVVLCPVNCNSHGACLMVKKLGKKHNKPVHMMSNFSLHAISSFIAAEAGAASLA